MPTNLPPDFYDAEKRYRLAKSPEEKIACLEEMLSIIPKHKGTDHIRADYRRQISKLKSTSKTQKGGSIHVSAFRINREGPGQVVVLGPTNVGKSALVEALTNATPDVAPTPYTTWKPTPGMMLFENVQIQLIDTPPLDREYLEPEFIDLIRRADLLLLVLDLQTHPDQQLQTTFEILKQNRILPQHMKGTLEEEQYIWYVPVIVLTNKCDDESLDDICQIFRELLEDEWPILSVSAKTGRNLDQLRSRVFEILNLIRVYSKAPDEEPDFSKPVVMKDGATLEEFTKEIHKDFHERLKFAKVWGSTAFEGQMVQRDYILQDGDVVELHI
ncbi:MAG: 50S ribosome-binding GTPase [Chloroflexota bacterium]|nr:MAG: 50S ribosome-binding GTPase [Chloroflexota bacterium]